MSKKPILVIGGGISGITSALEIAATGQKVILVEQKSYLGGNSITMNAYFPKLCPPYCGMEINFRHIRNNPDIQLLMSSEVNEINGSKGDFKVKIESSPSYVNSNCTLCGKCSAVCPVEVPDEFNRNITQTKAIHLPHNLAFPQVYNLNREKCKNGCNECVKVCPVEAINLEARKTENEFNVSKIIIATGWTPFDTSRIAGMNTGQHPDIVSNVVFERMCAPNGSNNGKIICPSDGLPPKKVAFIQCAGSRDKNFQSWCSAVCCSASLKQALIIREQLLSCEVSIHYIDLRVSGRNEDLLRKAENDSGIKLIKGKAALITIDEKTGRPMVHFENISANKNDSAVYDLVILAAGITPATSGITAVATDTYGFADTDRLPEGIIPVGSFKRPMDIFSSVKDATGGALKAIQD